jgi:predicted HicB family RNase H-like nuclease
MKIYKGFIGRFYIDSEASIIRGKVLNTRDTITFYGKTVAQAEKAFRESVNDYLKFCEELGVEPEKPFTGRLLLRIDPEMHRTLSIRAEERGQSINALIGVMLRSALKKKGLEMQTSPIPSLIQAGSSKSRTKVRPGSRPSRPGPL